MKKIMFAIQSLHGGGTEKVLLDILYQLDKTKYDITVVLYENKGVYKDKLPQGVKIITVKDKLQRRRDRLWDTSPSRVYKSIINEEYDTEIAFMEGFATKFVASSNNKNSKKIAWVHCNMIKNHWTQYMFTLVEEQKYYNLFDNVVFVSKDCKDSFEEVFTKTTSNKIIINNPIIHDEIIEKSNQIDVKFNEFTLVTVGRLEAHKGYDNLIKAHAQLVKQYPHKLVFVGAGSKRVKLEKLVLDYKVKNSVEFKGFIENPYPYIKSADVFVSSSISEAYPLVIAEAVILEKAILATNVSGTREILDGGRYGMLCEEGYVGIKKALEVLLKDKENMVNKYSQLAKERKEVFDYKKVMNEIENLI